MDINEIARRAGVSRATVSRYLNDGYVSAEKRKRISAVIDETGYVPSRQARQLRTGKTNLVGVVIPKINSQSVARMVSGITSAFDDSGYQLLLANTNNDEAREVKYLNLIAERHRVDGIILLATIVTPEHLEVLASLDVPHVILGQQLEGHTCVYHDDYHAVRDMTRSFLRTTRVAGYIGVTDRDIAAGHMRHQGFLDACHEAGLEVRAEAQAMGDFTVDSGYLCCERILDAVPDVDTIVCATDDMAYGAITCLREYGRHVPEDVQVAGVGDSDLSRILMPSVTTAHLFYKTSGVVAAQLLLSAMGESDDGPAPDELKMGYEIYARNSTR